MGCLFIKYIHIDSTLYNAAEAFAPPKQPYVNIDYFAGKCSISKAFRARGYTAASLDIDINEKDDTSCTFQV